MPIGFFCEDCRHAGSTVSERICSDYRELAQQARKDLRAGKSDTDVREVGDSHRKEANAKRRRKATK